jgi:hypothetical protein
LDASDSISYATEIYTDSSKIGGKVGAGVAIYTDKTLVRQCKYKTLLFKQSGRADSKPEVTGTTTDN